MSRSSNLIVLQSNDARQNELLVLTRAGDGALTALGGVATKGAGSGTPHLQSQGCVVLTGDGRHVLVTDAGSGDLAVFEVTDEGVVLAQNLAVGAAPHSVAEHSGLVYVLATGVPAVVGFRWQGDGFVPVPGSRRDLPQDADPAQVGFDAEGRMLVVTARGRDELLTFPVDAAGLLGEPVVTPSAGPTPYGFAMAPQGVLVVTEAFRAEKGRAAASSYQVGREGPTVVSPSLGNGRSEICWAVITPDGRHAFTTNFADGAVSHWAIGADGVLTLVDAAAGLTEDGRPGLRDLALGGNGRYLHALDADAGELVTWSVGSGGALTPVGGTGGLPATAAGLAAG
jgi:6-phosphogluconolactonase